ncbi:MAG: hypothetical protein VYB54_00760 [Pseudomonadota bacterium]|nr:hypothetical protein [Pseudomonadota bacterium]
MTLMFASGLKRAIRRTLAGAALAAMTVCTATAAEVIVLESTVAAFSPGVSLPANGVVSLPAGASISVLDSNGATRTITGPYSGPVAADAPGDGGVLSVLSQLVKEEDRERSMLGAVRAFSKSDVLRDPLAIDVSENGTFCLPPGQAPVFWRPEKLDIDTRFSIRNWGTNADPLIAYWKKGDRVLGWPPHVPIGDGETFLLKVEAAQTAAEVTILRMPPSVNSDLEQIVWLAQHGCRPQARRMVGTMRDRVALE